MEMMTFSIGAPRQRPLAQLIREHKAEVTSCDCCGAEVKRVTVMRDGKIIPRAELLESRAKIGEDDWIDERHHWKCFCRFCAGVLAFDDSTGFELSAFYRWLRSTPMKRASIREYIVRIRRLIELVPAEQLRELIAEPSALALMPYLGDEANEQSARNYAIALGKYQQFASWRRK